MDLMTQVDGVLGWPLGTAALLFAALCGVCAFIARFMSAPGDDSGLVHRCLYGVVNWLAQNHGKAANADDVALRQGK